jgi:hypothetical protein
MYRFIAFWLPLPPGIVAFFQLRRTIARWEEEDDCPAGRSDEHAALPQERELMAANTSKSKVS